jgi:peptidoglycan/xylan/chitin deacetylase (PgdA/CDA1 family)
MTPRHAIEGAFFVVERLITALLYPACLVLGRLRRGARVPVLMYHQVGHPLPGAGPGGEAVSPERFAQQIVALCRAGYRVIPLGALVRRLQDRRAGEPGRCAVLTFDDGLRGQIENACPVLERFGLPATFFLVAGAVGTDRTLPHLASREEGAGDEAPPGDWLPLSWEEAGRLAARGFEIGSHSLSHRSLGGLSPEEVEAEAGGSRAVLERRLGVPVEVIAYPFGSGAYGDFDAGTRVILHRAGYRGACTTVVGGNGPGSDPLALRRIPVEESDGPFRLRCKLAGAYDWVGAVKSFWQRLVAREDRVDAAALAAPAGGEGR